MRTLINTLEDKLASIDRGNRAGSSADSLQARGKTLTSEEIGLRLRQFIEPTRVLTREIDRIALASDASFYQLIPRAVVLVKNVEEVRQLFQYSHEQGVPLTFRAGGTSLSGQAITDGVLVDVSRYMRNVRVEDNGKSIRVQPGVIGQQANNALRLYGAKLGPDPASIGSCQMGGILANNASGMCCGVAQNAYHTLQSITFLLPSGTKINTAEPDASQFFESSEPELAKGILRLKRKIEADESLSARIREKYQRKNTTGYGLNAFLDYETPLDIFSHLLVGSEGTLGFIAEAVLNTVRDLPVKYTGLLLFADLHAACAAIVPLRDAGAAALELMDRASMRSVEDQPGVGSTLRSLPEGAAGLLVEFQTAGEEARRETEQKANQVVASLTLLQPAAFTSDATQQAKLWKVRKGMFPSVGAVRASGTTVIIEDIALPVEKLADAAVDLRLLLNKHGYPTAILFGHAKDGNLHFVLTQGFNSAREIDQYAAFIDDLVAMVVKKYDGALKAEHGTGRNMAPFVETEWGPEGYAVMCELKALVDAGSLLNPGVILNSDSRAHLANLKRMPVVEEVVDKCIECGACEHSCPSRDLTLTPRQRIVVRREMQRLKDRGELAGRYEDLERDFPYMVLDTCAVDGLCATDCPVGIDTGKLTKRFRSLRHSSTANNIAALIAKNFALAEIGGRVAMASGHIVQSIFGLKVMTGITAVLNKATKSLMDEAFWQWSAQMPRARRGALPSRAADGAEAVYWPACISRIMGALPGESQEMSVMQALLNLADRAGVKLYVPREITGKCCGVPFSSKGFEAAHDIAVNRTVASFYDWSSGGQIPILVDTSPCTYGLKTARPYLTPENQFKFDKLTILDSVEFVHDRLLPKLTILRKAQSVVLHPVCSATKMSIVPKLTEIAQACSDTVTIPQDAGCCAFAGDRGFLFPELTASATKAEAAEVLLAEHDGCYSSSRTCEIGMTRATGKIYRSYLHLLEQATKAESQAR